MPSPASASLRLPDLGETYVGDASGRAHVLLIESDPMLGLDLADALEAAGPCIVVPPDAPALVAALDDVPALPRPAWAEDVVGAVTPWLPVRSGR